MFLETENEINAIRPNLKRAKLAQLLVWAVMAFDILSIFSSYLQYNLLKAFQNNENVTEQMISSNDLREQIIGILYLAVSIASAATFIQWFRRAYYNLGIREGTVHSEEWAVWSWFVPIISLYRPYQIMREMWESTTHLINEKTSDYYTESSTTILGFWWALWIISGYVGNYILKIAFDTDTIENLLSSTVGNIVLSIIGIPLAIITVRIIKVYSSKEEQIAGLEKIEQIGDEEE